MEAVSPAGLWQLCALILATPLVGTLVGALRVCRRLRPVSLQKSFHIGMIIIKIIPCTCVARQCLQMLSQMYSHLRAKEAKSQPREMSFSHGS